MNATGKAHISMNTNIMNSKLILYVCLSVYLLRLLRCTNFNKIKHEYTLVFGDEHRFFFTARTVLQKGKAAGLSHYSKKCKVNFEKIMNPLVFGKINF